MDTLSKTVGVNPTSDVTAIMAAFEPIVRSICLRLQSKQQVGQRVKIGLRDTAAGWQGVEYDFTAWRYDKLIQQVELSVSIGIEWTKVASIHLSVTELTQYIQSFHLESPDLR